MNIEKELEKYNVKKDKLLGSLLDKLYKYSSNKEREVDNISTAITDLNQKKEETVEEIKNIAKAIDSVAGGK